VEKNKTGQCRKKKKVVKLVGSRAYRWLNWCDRKK